MALQEICVLGLGYIGLPTASIFATNGFQVLGVDVNSSVVTTINKGDIHIEEPGLKTLVQAAIHSRKLVASVEPGLADVFIIAVPTPITEHHRADMSYVTAAAHAIIPHLQPGNTVILESTSPPGTCRDLLAPIFEHAGFTIGQDLYLAHCPERVLPGKILQELIENHRVIGGYTPACAEKAAQLYGSIVGGDIHLTSSTVAELVKVMENTFRDVNIALANELALVAEKMGVNAWDVIRLANLHPRVNLHHPGPGVGGHCISVDPWFIIEQAPEQTRLIRAARNINDSMPGYVAGRVIDKLKSKKVTKLTILGVAYKGDVDDIRESPALEVIRSLKKAGIDVAIYDPHVKGCEFDVCPLEEAFKGSDGIILLTPHSEYKYLDPKALGELVKSKWLLDTRNVLNHAAWRQAGFEVDILGAPPDAPALTEPASTTDV